MTSAMQIGSACVVANLGPGVSMSGFAARYAPSVGVHDPITARAICVDSTCVVSVDVVGVDEDFCGEAREFAEAIGLQGLVVSAIHTHGGPAVMRDRLGQCDESARRAVLHAVERAIADAASRRVASIVEWSSLAVPRVAVNRRNGSIPSDAYLQMLRWRQLDGGSGGWLVCYPCHPTVLGSDNRLLTADYVAPLRSAVEASHDGWLCVFVTGTAGDLNEGHSAESSYSARTASTRTFARAKELGERLANEIVDPSREWTDVSGEVRSSCRVVALAQTPLDRQTPSELARRWDEEAEGRTDSEADVLRCWSAWARRPSAGRPSVWKGSVSAFRWGAVGLSFLPGEPFLAIDRRLRARDELTGRPLFVVAYSNGTPGYLPDAPSYGDGGYEVVDAHRYYGMPAPFASGSAEALADTVGNELEALFEGSAEMGRDDR